MNSPFAYVALSFLYISPIPTMSGLRSDLYAAAKTDKVSPD
jgi:hypothetical protein